MTKKKNRRQDHATKASQREPGPNERREIITRNPAPAELDLRDETKWFLIYTSPRGEAGSAAGLEEAGCATFWPSLHKTVTVGKRTTFDGDVATFPRYLFATGPLLTGDGEPREFVVKGRPIKSVFDIDGVQDIVADARGWIRVPNRAIRAIADFQGEVGPLLRKRNDARFREGGAATILSGPFMSFQATVVEQIGLDAVKVLLQAFGGEVYATLNASSLQPAA